LEKVISKEDFVKKNQNLVFKEGNKQILVLGVGSKVYALDNRCPHEGYPLSEGSADGKACVLTCNWHNWKFDLLTGKCFVGGDNVRTYPTTVTENEILIDMSEPTTEEIRESIIEGLEVAFRKRQYGRISREVSRFSFNNIDPLYAVKKSILWSHDKFEFGMSHAYAAMADWIGLYNKQDSLEEQVICLTETIDHISFDSLRHSSYPYNKKDVQYSHKLLLAAIEDEDRELAEALVFSYLNGGASFSSLEEVLSKAALAHYNDFGHSLIYVVKAMEASRYLSDREVDMALALCLVRSLCYTTREDLIPEFKHYGD